MTVTAKGILRELEALGRESCKKMLMNNCGVKEPCFGVRIGDMKPIQKRIKTDYQLALDLYDTGNYDAMYLAGLIADDARYAMNGFLIAVYLLCGRRIRMGCPDASWGNRTRKGASS